MRPYPSLGAAVASWCPRERPAQDQALCTSGAGATLVVNDGRGRREKGMSASEDRHPILYGVVGLERHGTGAGGMGFVGAGRRARVVVLSESLSFEGPEGGTVTVTSRPPGDDADLERARTWAPTGPYVASPRGRAQAPGDRTGPAPRPVEVEWVPTTVPVNSQAVPFEVCDLGDGYWAAVGRVPDAIVTIDSRGVPLSAVQLERLASRRLPAPAPPDIGERTQVVMRGLDDRFTRVPFARVHRFADYWALRAVEVDHVGRISRQEGLSREQSEALEAYWLRRVEDPVSDWLDCWRFERMTARHRARRPRRLRSGLMGQVWLNTLGPGGRAWFANRYTTVRRYTFRLRWRP